MYINGPARALAWSLLSCVMWAPRPWAIWGHEFTKERIV
jgi:hypothetical protein